MFFVFPTNFVTPVPKQAEENIRTPMLFKLFPHGQETPVWTHTYEVDTDHCSPLDLFAEALYFSPAKNNSDIPTVQLTLSSIDHIVFQSSVATENFKLQQSPTFASILKQDNFSHFLSQHRIPLSHHIEVSIFFQELTEEMLVKNIFEIPHLQRQYETALFMADGDREKTFEFLEKQAPKEWNALRQIFSPSPAQNKCQQCLQLKKTIIKMKKTNKCLDEYFNNTTTSGYNLRRK